MQSRQEYTTSQKGEKHKMTDCACSSIDTAIFSDDKSQCYDRDKPQTRTRGYIGVIGSRQLPASYKEKVKQIVEQLLKEGYDIASGGATGADNYALEALLELSAAHRGLIFSPWQEIDQFPIPVRDNIREFVMQGGKVLWGDTPPHASRQTVVAGLLGRNIRLVSGAVGLIAFPFGDSRGTLFTLRQAQKKNIPVRIFSCAEAMENKFQTN